jgi:hypothetical protein
VYEIIVQIPPMSPLVTLNNSTHSAIEVVWHGRRSRKQPLLGHTVHYRREHGQWEQLVWNGFSSELRFKDWKIWAEIHLVCIFCMFCSLYTSLDFKICNNQLSINLGICATKWTQLIAKCWKCFTSIVFITIWQPWKQPLFFQSCQIFPQTNRQRLSLIFD